MSMDNEQPTLAWFELTSGGASRKAATPAGRLTPNSRPKLALLDFLFVAMVMAPAGEHHD